MGLRARRGTKFRDQIRQRLDDARVVIVLWTDASVESDWVIEEAEEAKARSKLLPIRLPTLEYKKIPFGFRSLQVELADQPDRILNALKGYGLVPGKQPPKNRFEKYWQLIARKTRPPGIWSRRTALISGLSAATGIAGTIAGQRMWRESRLARATRLHRAAINQILRLPSSNTLLAASEDGGLTVYNANSGTSEHRIDRSGPAIKGLAYSAALKSIYAVHGGNAISIWNVEKSWERSEVSLPDHAVQDIRLGASRNKRAAILRTDKGVILECAYSEKELSIKTAYDLSAREMDVLFVPFMTPDLLASYAQAGSARLMVFDGNTGTWISQTQLESHDGPINCIRTTWVDHNRSSRSIYAFTASDNSTIRLGNHYNLKTLHAFTGHQGPVTKLALFEGKSQTILASTGRDATIRLWDPERRQQVFNFGVQSHQTTSLAFSNDGQRLFSGSSDGVLSEWSLEGLKFELLQ